MSFSIEEFKSAIGKRGGMMRDNRYVMTMVPPKCMREGTTRMTDANDILRDMEFWVDAVNIPGYQFALNIAKRWTYGPDEKRPYMPVFMPIACTFNADANGDYLRFFNQWMQYIIPHDWYQGGINQISNFSGRQYEVEYKNEYSTDITISVLNVYGDIVEVYYIKEAFPSMVSEIPMSYSSQNNIAKFQVNFEYLDWTTTTYSPSDASTNGTVGEDTPDPAGPVRASLPTTNPPNGAQPNNINPPVGNVTFGPLGVVPNPGAPPAQPISQPQASIAKRT